MSKRRYSSDITVLERKKQPWKTNKAKKQTKPHKTKPTKQQHTKATKIPPYKQTNSPIMFSKVFIWCYVFLE